MTPKSSKPQTLQQIKEILLNWHRWRGYYYSHLQEKVIIDDEWKAIRDEIDDEATAKINKLMIEAREEARQEFREKFHIDPTKKYHVVGTENAVIITEWEHYDNLQASLNKQEDK